MDLKSSFADEAQLGMWQYCLDQVHPDRPPAQALRLTPTGLFAQLYEPLCQPAGQAWVIAQMGQSLDGRIALPNGASRGLNGPQAEAHLHRLRALVDAVVIGSNTAEIDNPQLTVRFVAGPNPVRVILDRHARLPQSLRVFQDQAAETLQLVTRAQHFAQVAVPELVDSTPGVAEQAILKALSARGLHRVLIEGGGQTVSRFLQAGLVDRLQVMVAPLILGSGCNAFSLPEVDAIAHAWQGASNCFELGQDTLFDIDFSGP